MKRLSITALAVAAAGFSGVALAEPTPTSITSPDLGALLYGEMIELAGVVDASATLTNIFQNSGDVAWAVRQRGDLLADAGCNAPSGVAIVAGNVEGFEDYASLEAGKFSADVDATGLAAGLYCFALNFPGVGRAFVDFYIVDEYAKVSGGFRWEPVGTTSPLGGKSPTHAFDGVVGDAGAAGVVGAITVNYRELNTYCTFTPGKLTFYDAAGNADVASGIWAVLTNMAGECTNDANTTDAAIGIFPKDSVFADGKRADGVTETARGAIHLRWDGVPSTSVYEIDATPGFYGVDSWILLERGNAEVGERPLGE